MPIDISSFFLTVSVQVSLFSRSSIFYDYTPVLPQGCWFQIYSLWETLLKTIEKNAGLM